MRITFRLEIGHDAKAIVGRLRKAHFDPFPRRQRRVIGASKEGRVVRARAYIDAFLHAPILEPHAPDRVVFRVKRRNRYGNALDRRI